MNKCEECEVQTTREGVFSKVKIGMQKKRLLCPSCADYLRHERGRKVYIELLAGLLFSVIFLLTNQGAPWLFLNLYLVFIMMCVSIVPHELGHVLAGWMLRQKLLFIRFGTGHSWFVRKVRGVYLDVRSRPLVGFVGHAQPRSGSSRLTQAIIYACGPLANIGILLLVIFVFSESFRLENFDKTFSPWHAIFIANLILGVSNLIPYKLSTPGGPIPNDGMGILVSLFGKREIERSGLVRYLQCALVAFEYQDFQSCQAYANRVLAINAEHVIGRNLLAMSLESRGDIDQAISIYEQMLAGENVDADTKPMLQSNLAYLYLVKGDPDNYTNALALADHAMADYPWNLSVLSNYGGIQILAGDVDKGIKALRDRRFVITRPEVQAEIHALLAIGRSKKGQGEMAEKELKTALNLDPQCKFLARARLAVDAAKGHVTQ